MNEHTIENWKIMPMHGNDICLVGEVCGAHRTTSPIKAVRRLNQFFQVRTETGNIYNLGIKSPGLWEVQLQMKRPEKFKKIAHIL